MYTAPCNGVVSHGAQIRGLRVLPTTHAKQMRPRSLRAVQCFTHIYLPARTTVDAGDICTWRATVIKITGKTQKTPNLTLRNITMSLDFFPCEIPIPYDALYVYNACNVLLKSYSKSVVATTHGIVLVKSAPELYRWATHASVNYWAIF